MELREFFCPGCKTLLEVTDVTPGYPLVQEFEPDIETFYNEWIEEPVPTLDGTTARAADDNGPSAAGVADCRWRNRFFRR